MFLHISEFLFCHVYFSRPGGRCTCTFNCFIVLVYVRCYSFSIIMETAQPFVTSENFVNGPTSILLVGHSFVRQLVDYLQDQHVDNFNLCHESYKGNVLASGGLTMPWSKCTR